MEPPQGAGEQRISEPREEAGLSDGVHTFGAETERLHQQNFNKTIHDKIAAWSVGERLLDDRVYRVLEGRLTIGVYASLSTGNMFAALLEDHRSFPDVEAHTANVRLVRSIQMSNRSLRGR
jgi:hypothetical protein